MKVAVFLVLMIFPAIIFSAPMDEAKFKAWMKSVNIDGFKLMEVIKDGQESVAMFSGPSDLIQIRLGDISQFKQSTSAVNLKIINGKSYSLKGMNAAFGTSDMGSMLIIEAKNIGGMVTLGTSKKVSQDYLEKIAEKIKLFNK
ncbi:MAG: hypothetical protein LDL13_02395 [Calditerrivibrio sp.]|nr:hypothetical protein [Calditerrivibrio sp.]MCA1980494.1 hypothetical protein [Calditerrivibrio sp.]